MLKIVIREAGNHRKELVIYFARNVCKRIENHMVHVTNVLTGYSVTVPDHTFVTSNLFFIRIGTILVGT